MADIATWALAIKAADLHGSDDAAGLPWLITPVATTAGLPADDDTLALLTPAAGTLDADGEADADIAASLPGTRYLLQLGGDTAGHFVMPPRDASAAELIAAAAPIVPLPTYQGPEGRWHAQAVQRYSGDVPPAPPPTTYTVDADGTVDVTYPPGWTRIGDAPPDGDDPLAITEALVIPAAGPGSHRLAWGTPVEWSGASSGTGPPGPPGPPGRDGTVAGVGIDAVVWQHVAPFDTAPLIPGSAVTEWTHRLWSDAAVPGGIKHDWNFWALLEGALHLDVDTTDSYQITLRTRHDFGPAGAIVSDRKIERRITRSELAAVPFVLYDSISVIGLGLYSGVDITEALLAAPSGISQDIIVTRVGGGSFKVDQASIDDGSEARFLQFGAVQGAEGPPGDDADVAVWARLGDTSTIPLAKSDPGLIREIDSHSEAISAIDADSWVTARRIAAGTVGRRELTAEVGDILTDAVDASGNVIALAAALSVVDRPGWVTAARLGADSVTSAAIAPDAVTEDQIARASVDVDAIKAEGTPDATTWLRGDGEWQTPAGGGAATPLSDAAPQPPGPAAAGAGTAAARDTHVHPRQTAVTGAEIAPRAVASQHLTDLLQADIGRIPAPSPQAGQVWGTATGSTDPAWIAPTAPAPQPDTGPDRVGAGPGIAAQVLRIDDISDADISTFSLAGLRTGEVYDLVAVVDAAKTGTGTARIELRIGAPDTERLLSDELYYRSEDLAAGDAAADTATASYLHASEPGSAGFASNYRPLPTGSGLTGSITIYAVRARDPGRQIESTDTIYVNAAGAANDPARPQLWAPPAVGAVWANDGSQQHTGARPVAAALRINEVVSVDRRSLTHRYGYSFTEDDGTYRVDEDSQRIEGFSSAVGTGAAPNRGRPEWQVDLAQKNFNQLNIAATVANWGSTTLRNHIVVTVPLHGPGWVEGIELECTALRGSVAAIDIPEAGISRIHRFPDSSHPAPRVVQFQFDIENNQLAGDHQQRLWFDLALNGAHASLLRGPVTIEFSSPFLGTVPTVSGNFAGRQQGVLVGYAASPSDTAPSWMRQIHYVEDINGVPTDRGVAYYEATVDLAKLTLNCYSKPPDAEVAAHNEGTLSLWTELDGVISRHVVASRVCHEGARYNLYWTGRGILAGQRFFWTYDSHEDVGALSNNAAIGNPRADWDASRSDADPLRTVVVAGLRRTVAVLDEPETADSARDRVLIAADARPAAAADWDSLRIRARGSSTVSSWTTIPLGTAADMAAGDVTPVRIGNSTGQGADGAYLTVDAAGSLILSGYSGRLLDVELVHWL